MEFTSEEILDHLLLVLKVTENEDFATIRMEANELTDVLKEVDNGTLRAALLKLVKDGFVDQTSINGTDRIFNTPVIHNTFQISFEGLVFIENGGYHSRMKENQRKENAYVDLQTEQRKQSASLVRLNRWIVFGAIVVAIDSILNILHFFGVYYDTTNCIFCIKPT